MNNSNHYIFVWWLMLHCHSSINSIFCSQYFVNTGVTMSSPVLQLTSCVSMPSLLLQTILHLMQAQVSNLLAQLQRLWKLLDKFEGLKQLNALSKLNLKWDFAFRKVINTLSVHPLPCLLSWIQTILSFCTNIEHSSNSWLDAFLDATVSQDSVLSVCPSSHHCW